MLDTRVYTDKLVSHYEGYFGVTGNRLALKKGPVDKLNTNFFILEIPPNDKHQLYCYCTVGMSIDRKDDLIELVIYSPKADKALIELLTVCASYHRNDLPLNLHHTVNIGQSWLGSSECEYGFISLPYLDGEELELFKFSDCEFHCYWFIPITKNERDYKIENGSDALEQLFEDNQIDYSNPYRNSLVG